MQHFQGASTPSVSEIVERLGGPNEVAARLRITKFAVYKWLARGIPPSRYRELIDLAATVEVPLSFDELSTSSVRVVAA